MSISLRSNLNLGAYSPQKTPVNLSQNLPHPPRLQHSPSLPNIWFPPHSGPVPLQFLDNISAQLHRSLTPPLLMSEAAPIPGSAPKALPHDADLPDIEARPSRTAHSNVPSVAESKKHPKRHRKDREHSQLLLTPPLTPSASIRTVTSVDSVAMGANNDGSEHVDVSGTHTVVEEIEDKCPGATRFLLLGNVSRQAKPDLLRTAIVEALITNPLSKTAFETAATSDDGDILKGVFVRCQMSHGIVLLAFFDVRWAQAGMTILPIKTSTGSLAECVGNDLTEDGIRDWISCRFLTTEQLVETFGNSSFVETVNGSFELSAQICDHHAFIEDLHTACGNDERSGKSEEVADILLVLKRLSLSYGDVRKLCIKSKDSQAVKQSSHDFCLEYYDSRAADRAYRMLDNIVIHGLQLTVSGRDALKPIQDYAEAATKRIPNGGSEPAEVAFGRPGEYSQIRERFVGSGSANTGQHFRTSSASHDDDSSPPTHASAPSPTCFYSSSTKPADATTSPAHAQRQDYMQLPPEGPHRDLDPLPRQEPTLHCYTPMQDCRYCPSRGPPSGGAYASYYHAHTHPTPPPLPSIYYPPTSQSSPPASEGAPNMGPPAPQGYGYENRHATSMHGTMPNWIYDPGMVPINTGNAFPSNSALVPHPPAPYWYPDGHGGLTLRGGYYHSNQLPSPQENCAVPCYPSINDHRAGVHVNPPIQQHIYVTGPTSPTLSSTLVSALQPQTPSSTSASASSPTSAALERNQLNLARIEEGLDTRTTVMIKNIPNKMTDKDLIAYIGNVCPNKIDFLYLRMDFQNGCNVGYAFVNFICVQDLLYFAKERLGEKWNMFSSEKVLQMSYANYQGKEALVEKFKNSCIMDEREEWRPKIFYSSGPDQGFPEPFPPPTHLRRKERSSYNRGALFVPGVNGGGQPTHSHGTNVRRQGEQRSHPTRYLERQHHRVRHSDESFEEKLTA